MVTLRQADPDYPVEKLIIHLQKHHGLTVSPATVNRVLREENLHRHPGPPKAEPPIEDQRLELGGMKLVEAASEQTGYLKVITKAVVELVHDLERPEQPLPKDTSDRDDMGRFLSSYNERYRKGSDDRIGPGYLSVEDKRVDKDPDHLQLAHVHSDTMARKLWALMTSPLLGSGRWDGIRVPRGELLEELCGYAYMPATLERFTRELKYAGVSETMWEVHGRLWLRESSSWGGPEQLVVLYVDGTTKAIWTKLYSQSTKVKEVGRVMPGLETVAFHSGYGVPLWLSTYSGRAPLVKVVPEMLGRVEQQWGTDAVGRIVVIDAEGNSVPFLKGLEQGTPSRGWVTRLREDWLKGKRIYNRNSYRGYRDGDRVRSGVVDLNDPDGGVFQVRVVELERSATGSVVHLGASMTLREQDWKPQELADLYLNRWPAQEASFRSINQALGLKEMHGYGKRLVTNISVVTELDKLEQTSRRAEERLSRQQETVTKRESNIREEEKLLRRRKRRQDTVECQLQKRMRSTRPITESTRKLVQEQIELAKEVVERTEKLSLTHQLLAKTLAEAKRTKSKLSGYEARRQTLEGRREIFAHDVELDSLFSVLKVGLLLLVTFVLKEYLGNARMDVATFLERVATLPALLHLTPQLEVVTFEYNRRDPEVMGLLQSFCDEINARGLRLRSGRRLRLKIAPAPKPARPPPKGSRVGSGDRFKR